MNKKLILITAIAVTGLVLIVMLGSQDTGRQSVAKDLRAPDFSIIDAASGRKFTLADYKGKVLFVNFWATWCQPCRDEIPSIEALHREFSMNDNFRMITILYKDDPKNADEYLKRNAYTLPIYLDYNGASARNFGVTGVPETYVIGKDGVLREKVIGPADWASPDAKKAILSLL